MNRKPYFAINFAGMIFILSPAVGMLMSYSAQSVSLSLVAGAAAGIPVAGVMFNYLKPGFCTPFLSTVCIYSFFLIFLTDRFNHSALWCFIFGMAACGLFLVLPSNLIFNMSFRSRNIAFGVHMSLIIALGMAFSYIFSLYPFATFISFSVLMLISSLFMVKYPANLDFNINCILTDHMKKSRVKISFFFFLISLSLGFSFQIGYHNTFLLIFSGHAFNNILTISVLMGILTGPALISLFLCRKGAYSMAVFLIFLCEVAVACAGFYNNNILMYATGHFAFSAAISSLTVACPQIVYHMMGSVSYNKNFCITAVSLALGLLAACQPESTANEDLKSYQSVIIFLFLLVIGFFTIFSAWKHRFVLLK